MEFPLSIRPLAKTEAPTVAAMQPPNSMDPVEETFEFMETLHRVTMFEDKLTLPEKNVAPAEHKLEPTALKLKHDAPNMTLMPPPAKMAPLEDTLT